MTLLQTALRTHAFLKRNLFYPLVFLTGMVFFFFSVRIYLSGESLFIFLIWNLFLAWLPYWFSLAANFLFTRKQRAWWLILPLTGLWLLFLPNAPYIITDFMHLRERSGVPLWYDVGFLMSISLNGLFLGIASLRAIQEIIDKIAGRFVGWAVSLGAIGLSGLGVYLGRFLRWNSWDIIDSPFAILKDILLPFRHPLGYADKLGFIFMIAAMMLVGYWMIAPQKQALEQPE